MPDRSAQKPLAQPAENADAMPRALSAGVSPKLPQPQTSESHGAVKTIAVAPHEKPEASEQEWKEFLGHCAACEWEPLEKLLTERQWHAPNQSRWLPTYAWRHARGAIAEGGKDAKNAVAAEAGQEWWGLPLAQSKDARWSMPESLAAAWLASPGWKENIAFCYVNESIGIGAGTDALLLSALGTGGLSSPEKAEITKQMALRCAQYWNKEAAQVITELGGAGHFDDAFRATLLDTWIGTPEASAVVEDRRLTMSAPQRFAEASEQLRAFEGFGWFDSTRYAQGVILSAGITFGKDGNAQLFKEHGAAIAMALILSLGEKITSRPKWEDAVGSLSVRAQHNAHSCWTQVHGLAVALTERAALGKIAGAAKQKKVRAIRSQNDSPAQNSSAASTAAETGNSTERGVRKAASRL